MRNILPRFLLLTHIFAGIDNNNLADDCLEPYYSGGTKLLLPGAKADFSVFRGIQSLGSSFLIDSRVVASRAALHAICIGDVLHVPRGRFLVSLPRNSRSRKAKYIHDRSNRPSKTKIYSRIIGHNH